MSDLTLCECFARDGLQHETEFIPTAQKVALIDRFARAGFARVEATSYSNPAVVPQFADASEVLKTLPRVDGVYYKATCANVRAVERALADLDAGIGANEISLLVSASDAHSLRNLKQSREDQWQRIEAMAAAAQGRFRLIGTISVAFGCPFEGEIAESSVLADVERFAALGVRHVTLGDTIGVATQASTQRLFGAMLRAFPDVHAIAHFHDTRGTGIVNYLAAFEAGVRHYDVAFGGVGGHPAKVKYGGGVTGNVCTEDFVNVLETMGVNTGIDLAAMMEASEACENALGRTLASRVARTGLNPMLTRAGEQASIA
ncbi:hydroxymethylglutaryl-CoA lyase [Paraburkholderia sabiae]|uniref:Hydroxymethylglutaryl-CoA lyase n=1 Tax=Paraburkholderia sabiae TaxID=273251 RepID=A0ABU9Q8J8_9BURK|nr:hydroxymethylglutaryl-CoA lyase [Paraburkholderia sabiae]WJZ78336.1 hydroxymethylglutaryl-CoA lyase [Paraburkholderia sabiae]CAD6507401.1 Hydroxymethylglutaryl-CoA lyase YngG [Paraburkholderia sabiae]